LTAQASPVHPLQRERLGALTLRQVASYFGVHLQTVYKWRTCGVRGIRLRTGRLGGRIFVRKADADLFMQQLQEVGHE
jgi:hypothetical protein